MPYDTLYVLEESKHRKHPVVNGKEIVKWCCNSPRTTPLFHNTKMPNAARIVTYGMTETRAKRTLVKPFIAKETAVLK